MSIINYAEQGNLEKVIELSNIITIRNTDKNGNTALIKASRYGHFNTIKYLINYGACITDRNNYGETALICACYGGYFEIVKYIVQHSTLHYLNQKDNSSWNALMWASISGHFNIIKYLIKHNCQINSKRNRPSALLEAVSGNNIRIVKYLIKHGALLNHYVDFCETAVRRAQWDNHVYMQWYLRKIAFKRLKM